VEFVCFVAANTVWTVLWVCPAIN